MPSSRSYTDQVKMPLEAVILLLTGTFNAIVIKIVRHRWRLDRVRRGKALRRGRHACCRHQLLGRAALPVRIDKLDIIELTSQPSNLVFKEFDPLSECYKSPE
jgi:hypothetical protein